MAEKSPKMQQTELESLQKSFDDYVESSKEFEAELELALQGSDEKLSDISTKKAQTDLKLSAAQEKLAQLSKDLQRVQNDLEKTRGKLGIAEESIKKLESSNESLQEKVRILEATEGDLLHKLENAEEDIVFLQTDINELKEERSQTEIRLRAELTSLQAEMSAISMGSNEHGEYASHGTSENSSPFPSVRDLGNSPRMFSKNSPRNSPRNSHRLSAPLSTSRETSETIQLVEELELEVGDLTNRLSEAEQQNTDLTFELGRVTGELIIANKNNNSLKDGNNRETKLESLVKCLNDQLSEANDFLTELEESNNQLEESNTELYSFNAELDASNFDFQEKNTTLKEKNVALREENLMLEEKFLVSKGGFIELNDQLDFLRGDHAMKCRQLDAVQDALEEKAAEIRAKEVQIIKISAEIAFVTLELESVKVQLVLATGDSSMNLNGSDKLLRNGNHSERNEGANTGAAYVSDTEGVIERLKKTINDLTLVSECSDELKEGSERGSFTSPVGTKSHGELITDLRNSVDSLSATLESFELNLKLAATQLAVGKDALNSAEYERDILSSSVQKLGEKYSAREVESPGLYERRMSIGCSGNHSPINSNSNNSSFNVTTTRGSNSSRKGELLSFLQLPQKFTNPNYEFETVSPLYRAKSEKEKAKDKVRSGTSSANKKKLSDAWETERSELMARLTEYQKEIEVSRSQAALQQRQALLEDYPSMHPVGDGGSERQHPLGDALSPVTDISCQSATDVALRSPHPQQSTHTLTHTYSHGASAFGFTTSMRMAAERAIASEDVGKLKSELNVQLDRYDTVRATNAKLLQRLQAVRGNIQVCCRTRPPTDKELAAALVNSSDGNRAVGKICVDVTDENEISCYDRRAELWRSFVFDRVWPFDATQAEVFSDVEPLVLSVTEGFNTCLFAYGQTGSGKTFTMNGYGREYGVSYRTLQRIFETLELKRGQAEATALRLEKMIMKDPPVSGQEGQGPPSCDSDSVHRDSEDDEIPPPVFSYSVQVSMMEIYNEQVYDLLAMPPATTVSSAFGSGNTGGTIASAGLDIRQAPDGTVSVPGLHQVTVHSLSDVMEVFSRGSGNRATTTTNLNEHSSRSHLIMHIDVLSVQGDSSPVKAKLFLVDLAGSERVGKSGVTGQAMKEAQYINKSLSALGDVMEALDQKAKFIPYRNSKLTYLLQDALGGNSRTMMVVTVCPTESTTEETLFTLQFASRVRNISIGPAKKNSNTKNMEEAVRALKAELKDSKKKRQSLEDNIGDIKKESKKFSDKNSSAADLKLRATEEKKLKLESQLLQMQKSHQEMAAKWQEEKEGKLKVQEQLKEAVKEKEKERAEKDKERIEREKERILEKECEKRQNRTQLERERSERMKADRPLSYRQKSPIPIVISSPNSTETTLNSSTIRYLDSNNASVSTSVTVSVNASPRGTLESPRATQNHNQNQNLSSFTETTGGFNPLPGSLTGRNLMDLLLPSPPSSFVRPAPLSSRSMMRAPRPISTPFSSSAAVPPQPSTGRTSLPRTTNKPPVPIFSNRQAKIPTLANLSLDEDESALRVRSKIAPSCSSSAFSSLSSTPANSGRKGTISQRTFLKAESTDDFSVSSDGLLIRGSVGGGGGAVGAVVVCASGDELEVTTESSQILTPAARTNIANRSKEALQRHQERMEKRRADKLQQQLSQIVL